MLLSCLTLYNGECEETGRSLDHKALEDIRIQAVQRVEAGEAPSAVMRVMGFARTVIYDWLNKYRAVVSRRYGRCRFRGGHPS